ncbi:hypothetical protein AKJ60_00035 [candidate division MSBL1 archaeon SCGC-AAA385M11]|nr:hypothetical protein AKJ60_00035 [candidate division MSBL1 archaeon SCGC-AAA385M11]
MCGIAGIINYRQGPAVDQKDLLRMRETMISRGPDGAGLWISGNGQAGLVHRRLSIIDLSDKAAQPMASENNNVQIVFNGEIYNYKLLCQELEQKGVTFKTVSDTEVILYLYQIYGEDFVYKLRGMFAIALYETTKQKILLIRDPFGIKPLYYADDGKRLIFASQVSTLVKSGLIDTAKDAAGQVGFFLWGHIPEPYTIYRQIRSLEPGTTMTASPGNTPVFNINNNALAKLKQYSEFDSSNESLREIVLDSVRQHLVSDVPVGAFLSAGIDSATICSLVMEAGLKHPLQAVTLGFQEFRGSGADEVSLARENARRNKIQHEVRWLARKDFTDSLDDFLKSIDQPTINGLNTWFVSKVTAETGLKVALSGIGGDEFFAGYSSFKDIPRLTKYVKHVPRFIGAAFRRMSAPVLPRFISPKYAGVLEFGNSLEGSFLLRRGLFMPWELPKILDKDVVQEGLSKLNTMKKLSDTSNHISSERMRVMALETRWYMQSRLLRDTDWAGMAHSLEIRTPLVDSFFFGRLVPHIKQTNGNAPPDKKSLAGTPNPPLPESVINRPKSGFNVPVREWLLEEAGVKNQQRGLRDWAEFIAGQFEFEGLRK